MTLRQLAIASAAVLLSASAAQAASDDWLARAGRELASREYQTSRSAAGLQAPNRAHDLRTYFDASGIHVHGRTAPGGAALLALSLAGVGRGDALFAPSTGEIVSEGARVEIRRDGLVEWYENSPAGLEQGFTLAERPAGAGALVLELALDGATASAQGDALALATRAGRLLRYGSPLARDAWGRELPVRLAAPSPQRIRILVEDAGAAYPVVIDPLLTATPNARIESDQVSAQLGLAVAGAGDVNGDGYDDVIVGAYRYDSGQTDEGAAFLFLGSAAGIASGAVTSAATMLESNQAASEFGRAVAGAGDVNGDGYDDVIVGAHYYSNGESNEGAAFLFLGSASGIASASAGSAAARFESDQAGAFLGYSVAGAGDVNGDGYDDVIIGAPNYGDVETHEGAAFLFMGSASGIVNGNPGNAAATFESNQPEAYLGYGVSGAGDVNGDGYDDIVVGAQNYSNGQSNEGAAFVFDGSASGIASGDPTTASARLESNQGFAFLGYSVAAAGDVNGDGYGDVIVGAHYYSNGQSHEGAAFVFHGSASGIANGNPGTANAVLDSNQDEANLGYCVAGAGDVNGDGYDDVIVGAVRYDSGAGPGEGAAFVFLGSASGVASGGPDKAYARLAAGQAGTWFGLGVAGAGDVNGDGYGDVVVGAPLYDAGETDEGAAFLYLGGVAGGVPIPSHGPVAIVLLATLLGVSALLRLRWLATR